MVQICMIFRSREQRYTKLADWGYIKECVPIAAPLPLFGNGDVMSCEEYEARRGESGVAGIMIGEQYEGKRFGKKNFNNGKYIF